MKTVYRIYTERKNLAQIRESADLYLGNYTLIEAEGAWKGGSERSLIIEHIADSSSIIIRERVSSLAALIKGLNAQEGVLVTAYKLDEMEVI